MGIFNADKMLKQLFGASEVQNRIAKNTLKLILGDITTLYKEFRKAEGPGALFFNTEVPNRSVYLDTKEIYNDIILAEELMDKNTKNFLTKLLNVVEKNEDNETPIVVMVNGKEFSIHLLDLNSAEETLDKKISDATS